jgi:uncharacterized protein YggE
VPVLALAQQVSTPAPPQVTTTGVGEAVVVPDRATIVFAVETRASTAAAAAADNARRQRAVIDALKAKGVVADHITTAGYSVVADERYDAGQRTVTGYVARNSIVVEVGKLEQLGALIDTALAAEANLVSSLRLYSSRFDDVRRVALRMAVAQAKEDASAMAVAAGGSLGPLLEVTSNDAGMPRPMMQVALSSARMAGGAAETPIAPGEQRVSVSVTTRWLFVISK